MPTLYIDMDGVVADFNTAAQHLIQATDEQRQQADRVGRWPTEVWSQLLQHPRFYRDLPLMPGAVQLMAIAHQFETLPGWRLRMLTAIPKGNDMPDCFHDKIDWMRRHWPDVRVCFGPYSHDKQHHYRDGDILVDDRVSNCAEWRQRGGRAILVKDMTEAIRELDEIWVELNQTFLWD